MALVVDPNVEMHFTTPVVTPRHYIARGPSGWPETYPRVALDKELQAFAGAIGITALIDLFRTQRELSENPKSTDWFTIVGFLGRMFQLHPKQIPHTVAICFWAHVVISTLAGVSN